MFSKSWVSLALICLSASGTFAAPAKRNNAATCDASAVVSTKTVTVTATVTDTAVAVATSVTTSSNISGSSSGSSSSTTSNNSGSSSSGSSSGSSSSTSTTSGSSGSNSTGSKSSGSKGTGSKSSGSSSTSSGSSGSDSTGTDNTGSGTAGSTGSTTTTTTSSDATSSDTSASSGSNTSTTTTTTTTNTDTASDTTSATGSLSTDAVTTNATENNSDPQFSLTLDPRVIATGFFQNGQNATTAAEGQVASLTSPNNFINYCLTQNTVITNGLQVTTGSCNPAPIGTIPSVQNMPSTKFSFPANGGTVQANTAFNVTLNIQNIETGNFVNAEANYFAAPQQLNSAGQIIGHTHVVIEAISSLSDTTPPDPQTFAFFKGIDAPAVDGVTSAAVTSGVPAGTYRLCSITSSANHQPAIVAVAQHGNLDDCIYFTSSGGSSANATAATATAAARRRSFL